MKKLLLFGSILLGIQFSSSSTYSQIGGDQYTNQDYSYQSDISYQTFYDNLSPYGQWIEDPTYGNVWQPSVADNFKPYATNGHWVYSDIGWTWVSGYNWGWATFHYGRWFFDNEYGWLWIPGYDWAPAWVSWRSNNDYYGWAPLAPNVSINISIGSYNPPSNYWCFVPNQYICSPNVNNYYISENRNITIINNTTIINNVNTYNQGYNASNTNNSRNNNRAYFAAGPNPREVEHFTGNTVHPVVIRDNGRPGNAQINGRELLLFRPRVAANTTPVRESQQRMSATVIDPSRNPRTAVQDFHPAPAARTDNRSIWPERRNDVIHNSQPVNNNQSVSPVAGSRMNPNNNGNIDAARRQNFGNPTPVVNTPRPVVQSPAFSAGRPNTISRNEYRQVQPSQQRMMVQPSQQRMMVQPSQQRMMVQPSQQRMMVQQPQMGARSTPQAPSGRPYVR